MSRRRARGGDELATGDVLRVRTGRCVVDPPDADIVPGTISALVPMPPGPESVNQPPFGPVPFGEADVATAGP